MRDIFLKYILIFVVYSTVLPLWGMDPFERSFEQDCEFFRNGGAQKASAICLSDQKNGYIAAAQAQRFYPDIPFDKQCPEICLVSIDIKNDEDECLFSNIFLPYQLLLKDTYTIPFAFKSYDDNKNFQWFEFNPPLKYTNSDKEFFRLNVVNKVNREYCMKIREYCMRIKALKQDTDVQLIEQALKYQKKIAALLHEKETQQSLSLNKLKKNNGYPQQGGQKEINTLKAEIDTLNKAKSYWTIGFVLLSLYSIYLTLRLVHIIQ